MMKKQIQKLEGIKKNILKSVTHELVTYLSGGLGYLQQGISILEKGG
jgi:hypothetical protein